MIDQFLQYLHLEKRYSQHTLVSYKNDLYSLEEFLMNDGDDQVEWGRVHFKDLRSWMVNLSENLYTEKSINRKLSSVRSFYKYLKKKNYVSNNPAQLVQGPKIRKKLPAYIPEKDLLNTKSISIDEDDYDGQTTLLIVEILYQTGIRLSELINIKESDITGNSIKVLGKRNKERIIPISPKLYEKINDHILLKPKTIDQSEDGWLLLTKKGKKAYPKFVYRKVNDYIAKVSNIDKKSPHVLRHTFATHMLNNGASLEMIKEILGHASLVATQVYTHNSLSKLKQVYNQAHPRGGR